MLREQAVDVNSFRVPLNSSGDRRAGADPRQLQAAGKSRRMVPSGGPGAGLAASPERSRCRGPPRLWASELGCGFCSFSL